MLSLRTGLLLFCSAALLTVPALANKTTHKSTSSHKVARSATSRSGLKRGAKMPGVRASKSHKLHGQQVIDANRVTEIQQALIREHYLTGAASGSWDQATQTAMQKYQSDQGWQTHLMPDSRALKKLGLGPDYSGAINAGTGSLTPPAASGALPADQAAGFAAASHVSQ